MSKKKRFRKEMGRYADDFADALGEVIGETRTFLAEASPYEISLRMAELGVSSAYPEAIRKFLAEWEPEIFQGEEVAAFEALGEKWEEEVIAKRGEEPSFEDSIFLTEAARYYCERNRSV